jgi:protoheme IX farnesyltransferase
MSAAPAHAAASEAAAPRSRAGALAALLALAKPRLLPLVLFTGLPALALDAGGLPPLGRCLGILLGIAGAAAAANAFNMVLERERDALMERTRLRPLPAGALRPSAAVAFGSALAALSTAALAAFGSPLGAGLGAASIVYYVLVYTVWAKPRTAWNAVVGAPAGAAAPLLADAAADGRLGAAGLLLFAIVVVWQPPHVWAIALYRGREYAAAGIPMLPARIGEARARRHVLGWSAALAAVSLAPSVLGLLGPLYLAAALALGAGFAWAAWRLVREASDAAARRVFVVSLVYLALLFAAMLADLALAGG